MNQPWMHGEEASFQKYTRVSSSVETQVFEEKMRGAAFGWMLVTSLVDELGKGIYYLFVDVVMVY